MNENRSAIPQFLVFALGLAWIGYLLAKAFSDQIGVDISAGGRLLFGIVLSLGLIAYATWNELSDGLIGYRGLLPIALSTLWGSLWPAMQFWGAKPFYFPGLPIEQHDVAWWASAWMQWGGGAVILIGGYSLAYWSWRRR
jgi:hypothetical protein